MAYNKAREEKKWRLWKEAEEKQLRKLGVDESTIETLRTHDWAIFNSDRRYYQRMQEAGTYLEGIADDTQQPEIKTIEDFLDSIENQQLYQVLMNVDKLTLQIALMKIQGYFFDCYCVTASYYHQKHNQSGVHNASYLSCYCYRHCYTTYL